MCWKYPFFLPFLSPFGLSFPQHFQSYRESFSKSSLWTPRFLKGLQGIVKVGSNLKVWTTGRFWLSCLSLFYQSIVNVYLHYSSSANLNLNLQTRDYHYYNVSWKRWVMFVKRSIWVFLHYYLRNRIWDVRPVHNPHFYMYLFNWKIMDYKFSLVCFSGDSLWATAGLVVWCSLRHLVSWHHRYWTGAGIFLYCILFLDLY